MDLRNRKILGLAALLFAHAAACRDCPRSAATLAAYDPMYGAEVAQNRRPSDAFANARYRKVSSERELNQIASLVAAATGTSLHGRLKVADSLQSPRSRQIAGTTGRALAQISGPPHSGVLTISREALDNFSANYVAFILGHEFAHQLDPRAQVASNLSVQEQEIYAEISGAEYAACAGFDLDDYLSVLDHGPDRNGFVAGFGLERANAVRAHFASRLRAPQSTQWRASAPGPKMPTKQVDTCQGKTADELMDWVFALPREGRSGSRSATWSRDAYGNVNCQSNYGEMSRGPVR